MAMTYIYIYIYKQSYNSEIERATNIVICSKLIETYLSKELLDVTIGKVFVNLCSSSPLDLKQPFTEDINKELQ